MRILYHDRLRIDEKQERELNATYTDLKTLLSQADFVSLHVTLTDETRHLIGARELSYMKPTAYLINAFSRPGGG